MKRLRWHFAVWTLLFLAGNCLAQNLRVTSWDMAGSTTSAGQPGSQIQEAAAALKKLNPDVILLQHVRDWQMCGQLAQALKPANYSVLVCSSFRDAQTGASSRGQAAILSKPKAYFSWSEAWRAEGNAPPCPGGFAFAAIQTNQQRIGFFCVQLDRPAVGTADGRTNSPQVAPLPTRQWLQAVAGFRRWTTNRLNVAVVVCCSNSNRTGSQPPNQVAVVDAEIITVFLGAPLFDPLTLPRETGQASAEQSFVVGTLVPNPETLPGVVLDHSPATCDLAGSAQEITVRSLVPADAPRNLVAQAQAKPVLPSPTNVPAKPTPSGPAQTREAGPVAVAEPGVQASGSKAPSPAPNPAASKLQPQLRAWVVALTGLAGGALMMGILARKMRRHSRSSPALLTVGVPTSFAVVAAQGEATISATDSPAVSGPNPGVQFDAPGTQTLSEAWPQGTLPVEQRLKRGTALDHPGLILHLSQWLKQKLVQKLVTDRADLLQTQATATSKLATVDERLARIEQQIQQQTQAYQNRIDELTRELLAAKEQNRELIRARIKQVKAEMDAARARLIARTREEEKR